jgi:uncharacterized protein (DUF362 family)/Pyruvate/2-oxoacid:ferredoxin oxidoreductase delta subunit
VNVNKSKKRDAPTVSIVDCGAYELHAVRQGLAAVLAPLGGVGRFVRPGMKVLLKPNLLTAASPERAVTTHPVVVQAVAELVQEAGGVVSIGDSPAGPLKNAPMAWRKSGLAELGTRNKGQLISFEEVTWKRLDDKDYLIARPVFETDLVINLPKLKTHMLTLYTGAVKNLFGTIPGTRKRELHFQAPGVQDFSSILVDVLALVQPGLTIMDGILGQEGNGPGMSGTPHRYGCLAASTDPVALDTVMTEAMGYRQHEVRHLAEAGHRRLGVSDLNGIRIVGNLGMPDFGDVHLPNSHWYFHAPRWAAAPLRHITRLRPQMRDTVCTGCGKCAEACPRAVITPGSPPTFDLDRCIGCLCCAEVCPQGAIVPHRNLIARLIGMGY